MILSISTVDIFLVNPCMKIEWILLIVMFILSIAPLDATYLSIKPVGLARKPENN